MDIIELRFNLNYLIMKYIPENKHHLLKPYIVMDDIPVKGILATFNKLCIGPVEEADGVLIRKIYFYYC